MGFSGAPSFIVYTIQVYLVLYMCVGFNITYVFSLGSYSHSIIYHILVKLIST